MPDFIFEANIAYYKTLPATEIGSRKVAMLHKLLAEEEAKLADWHRRNPKSGAAE